MAFAAVSIAGCERPAPATLEAAPPPLPMAVANNAVAAVENGDGWSLFSFLGIDSTKIWRGVTDVSYRWDVGTAAWRRIEPPPGPARLAATAQTVGGRIYLFGGYTVAEDGAEQSVPAVDVFDPITEQWSASAPIPIPVDDAVSGVWRDSLIYLISGWHDSDNEAAVQIYDPSNDRWQSGTPVPGPPVFGHAGGISGDAIVYIDGTRVDQDPRAFVLEGSSWIGRIDPSAPADISWARLPDHPGPALYRAASTGLEGSVIFAGGSDNTYNFDGLGYNGVPAEPSPRVFAFDLETETWVRHDDLAVPTMDHRNLARAAGRVFSIGGMTSGQQVTRRAVEIVVHH